MKVTVVPAQVTTVEDRVAGNLGLNQLILLSTPLFIGSMLYVVLPPFFHSAVYKSVVICIVFVTFCTLAIRIKGKITLLWLILLLRYFLRPRYYVFDKQSLHGRAEFNPPSSTATELEQTVVGPTPKNIALLSPSELMSLQDLISNPATNLKFELNKKGNLYVRLTEVQTES